jgi:hypothetical protein
VGFKKKGVPHFFSGPWSSLSFNLHILNLHLHHTLLPPLIFLFYNSTILPSSSSQSPFTPFITTSLPPSPLFPISPLIFFSFTNQIFFQPLFLVISIFLNAKTKNSYYLVEQMPRSLGCHDKQIKNRNSRHFICFLDKSRKKAFYIYID